MLSLFRTSGWSRSRFFHKPQTGKIERRLRVQTPTLEQTLVMIKPDAFERGLVEMIRSEIQVSGFTIIPVGQAIFTLDLVREFYQFENIEWAETVHRYLCSRSIPLWLVEGQGVVVRMMEIKRYIRKNMLTGNPQNLLHCSSSEKRFHWEYSVLIRNGMIVP